MAMVLAGKRSSTGEEWWADVLADPRARRRNHRIDTALKQDAYRLSDEQRAIILVACSKCDWRAAYPRDELVGSYGAKAQGFSVVTAAGGMEGLRLAKELQPTAITLDIMMPDLDGWSVLAALRQNPELADIPVIMVSIVDDKRRGIALGAAGYLTKPIDRERLHKLVRRFQSPTPPTHVLMVEDDALQRERMLGWLERPQWIVREAANGREALNVLREEKPDVILLDLMMPEMDGFEVVAALQKDACWREIPVIVITSLDLNAKDRERLNSGVQSVLVKEKFRPEDLVERIRRLVQARPAAPNQMEAAL
jgi:CheY-like chemotaxis protein